MLKQDTNPFDFIPGITKIAGCLQKSTVVMRAMGALLNIPDLQASMRELSKEMMKVIHGFVTSSTAC